jgi:hypothetical protein
MNAFASVSDAKGTVALRDLDTGLFFSKGQWTMDPRFAQVFPDREAVERLALELKINNPEMVFIGGEPPKVTGGIRLSP